MRITRILTLIIAVGFFALLSTAVAWADPPGDAPNVVVLTDVDCDGEALIDVVYVPADQAVVGLQADGPVVGIAKYIEVEIEDGVWVPVLVRGIQGNPNTVECTWSADGLNFRGQVLIARSSG